MFDTARISAEDSEKYPDAGDLDVTLTFDLEGEEVPSIPHSTGERRSSEVSLRAKVITIEIGNWVGGRGEAVLVFGAEHLHRIEEDYAQRRIDQYERGDF